MRAQAQIYQCEAGLCASAMKAWPFCLRFADGSHVHTYVCLLSLRLCFCLQKIFLPRLKSRWCIVSHLGKGTVWMRRRFTTVCVCVASWCNFKRRCFQVFLVILDLQATHETRVSRLWCTGSILCERKVWQYVNYKDLHSIFGWLSHHSHG